MTAKKRDENDDTDLKPNEPQAKEGRNEYTASDTRPSDREVERSEDRSVLTPENDPKQNEDLGIPGGYTEAQKERMRASRDEPPNTPDIDPEAELETIKRNTEAAVEGRSVDIGNAPNVGDGGKGGKMEAPHSIPSHEMQTQISNEMDAERRKEQQKQQQEHDEEAKKLRDAMAADQKQRDSDEGKKLPKPAKKAEDDDDEDEETGKKGRKR